MKLCMFMDQFGAMIGCSELYILILVWLTLTLIQGDRSTRKQKNFCASYLTKLSTDLDWIWYTVGTCWCDQPRTQCILSI